jgi:hypothetical protein
MAVRIVVTVLTVLSLDVFCRLAQGDPQPTGMWRIEPVPDKETEKSLSLGTSAVNSKDATLSIWCERDVTHYYLAIRDSRLARLPSAAEAAVTVRVGDGEPAQFVGTSRGNGQVIIQERVHQTAFSLILASLSQGGAGRVELSIDDQQWVFPMDGFASAMESLIKQCGFAPDPMRARQRGRR